MINATTREKAFAYAFLILWVLKRVSTLGKDDNHSLCLRPALDRKNRLACLFALYGTDLRTGVSVVYNNPSVK